MTMPDSTDYVPPAYQAQPHATPPEVWTLTLNRYQRDNLLQLIQNVMEGDQRPAGQFNSGDWVGEIRWMLGKQYTSAYGPGVIAEFSLDENDRPNPLPLSDGRPPSGGVPVRGFVVDAGGGEVVVRVDRDTLDYPHVNSVVLLYDGSKT